VGHDRERDAVRAFRLSRVITGLTDAGPGIEPPEGFVAIDHIDAAPRDPTDLSVARVAFTPEAAVLAEGNISGALRERVREDGWVVLGLPSADPDTLGALVLGYGPEAEVLGPPTLRADVIARLEAATGG
jgi:proteasome accessory factor B